MNWLNGMNWKHWLSVIGIPVAVAFLTAFQQSGETFSRVALQNDGKAALAAFVVVLLALFQRSPSDASKLAARGIILSALLFLFPSCSSAKTAADVNLGVCILTNLVPCLVANPSNYGQCIASTAQACGTDVASVTSIYAAHIAAETKEGFVPKLPLPIDAGTP